jgi:hypothetical protein
MHTVNFTDAQLQKCYDSNLAETDDLAQDLRQIRALIATYDLFQMLDGPHSVRADEILDRLVSAELRPALRGWYQRSSAETEPVSMEFLNELNELTGERLEIATGESRILFKPKKQSVNIRKNL